MGKTHWRHYELKKMGMHLSTIRAIQRIQRNQIYADKKQEELKRTIKILICQFAG